MPAHRYCATLGVMLAVLLAGCSDRAPTQTNAPSTTAPPQEPPPAPVVDVPAPITASSDFELPDDHFFGGITHMDDLEVRAVNRYWAGPAPDMLPLAEAMDHGLCILTETGRHDSLMVNVRGKLPVLVLAGDLLIGGRQDRFVASSVVLEPGTTILRVFCAEHERWTPDGEDLDMHFTYDVRRPQADLITKETIRAQRKQADVNGAVSLATTALNAPTYRQAYDAPQAGPITRMVKRAGAIVGAFTIGFAVYRDDELIAVDMFESTLLLQQISARLLRSYAMTAVYGEITEWEFESKPVPQPEPTPPRPEPSIPENFEPPPPELPGITDDGFARFECRRQPNDKPVHTGIFRNRQ